MNLIANKEFKVSHEFRHPKGGVWRIDQVLPETGELVIVPIFGTRVKARDQLIGRTFRIQGVWFKITDCSNSHVRLCCPPQP